MWGVLYRAVDQLSDPGNAEWEARGGKVYPVAGRLSLRTVWAAGATGGMPELATDAEHVWS